MSDDASGIIINTAMEVDESVRLAADGATMARVAEESIALTDALALELLALRRQRLEIERRIKSVLYKLRTADRPRLGCLRCGHEWRPHAPDRLPLNCARCHSPDWMRPPTENSRNPGDPPAPSWSVNHPPGPSRKRGRPPKKKFVPLADPTYEFAPTRPAPPPARPAPVRLTPPPRPPDDAPRNWSVPHDFQLPEPEHYASAPPPPQPETIAPAPETPASIPETPAPIHETIPPLPDTIPADEIGQPRSDAEREELEKAQSSAWPVTRGDDYE